MPSVPRLPFATLVLALLSLAAAAAQPRLQLELDRSYYLERNQNNLYLKTTVVTGSETLDSDLERPPANIVFLVDRSGSMDGPRLVQLKAALRHALTYLSSDDRIALVAFGSSVETLIPSTPVDQLSAASGAIETLATEGGADLFTGLQRAQAELRRYATPRSFDRVVLVCDGPPNKGPRDLASFGALATELAQENISIAAFALGGDAPSDLLFRLVEPSAGPLYDATDPTQLTSQLATEIQTLNQAIGKDAVLEIEFASSIEIVETIGRQAERDGRSVTFRFEKLLADQELSTIVQATLPASSSIYSPTEIAKARLSYQPTLAHEDTPVVIEAAIETRFVPSSSQSFESIAPHVYQSVSEGEVADTIREAVEAVRLGKSKQALRDLKKLARAIRDVASDLPDLQAQPSLDQLTRAIDSIENASQSPIEHRALLNTLYPTPAAPTPTSPQ